MAVILHTILDKNVSISFNISQNFVPECPIDNKSSLIHIMA